jgi:hypothetical protein
VEMKCLFSIAPEARKDGESPECSSLKNSNQTLDQTRSRVDLRVRSALVERREVHTERATSTSEGPQDRSVRLASTRSLGGVTRSGHGGASGHMRSDASNRVRSSLDSDRMPGAARPVIR